MDPIPDLEPVERGVVWTRRLINVVYVFVASIAGMISGAVVVYVAAAVVYLGFFSDAGGNPSEQCARGMAVGFLSIVSGAFLGTVGGSALAVKHPLCKGSDSKSHNLGLYELGLYFIAVGFLSS